MFAAAICVSILLGVLVWALPGRLCDRRATHADVLAGPGIVLAVWIIAACVFAQPGLAQGFDLFRLLAINGAALWACGTVLLLRLRSGRRYRTLWTVAALLVAAIGLEVFVGNAPYFATHGYQPVDLRAYLQDAPADGEPIALNDEHSTLTFTGIHQPLHNVALDGVVYQYDGNYPQDQNPLFILWVSGTDEASTAPRQSWQWQAAPRAARSLVRTLDFSGAVDTLTLQAEGYSGEYRSYDLNYTVQAVLANVPRPMDFSLLRLAVVYLALLALWGLRPGAAAWHEAYLTHRAKYRPAVLVLGWCGGYAVCAQQIAALRKTGELPPRDAALLLLLGCCSGPGFVVGCIGGQLFGSVALGLLLYGLQLAANLAAAACLVPFLPKQELPAGQGSSQQKSVTFPQAISNAVQSSLTVCGCAVFCRVVGSVLGQGMPDGARPYLNAALEISAGCADFAAAGSVAGVCLCLSLLGASVLAQLAALLQGTVPLGLLLAARVLHFMFLQGLLHLCLPLVPGQAAVFTSLAPQVVVMKRTAWDTALAIAFFLCAALYQLYKTCQSSYNNTIPAAHRSRADGPR